MNPNPIAPLEAVQPAESKLAGGNVINATALLGLKSKTKLVQLAQKLLPGRRFRVLTDPADARGGGHAFNLCEEIGTDGKLVFLTGGPNLPLVGSFLMVKVESGELK